MKGPGNANGIVTSAGDGRHRTKSITSATASCHGPAATHNVLTRHHETCLAGKGLSFSLSSPIRIAQASSVMLRAGIWQAVAGKNILISCLHLCAGCVLN